MRLTRRTLLGLTGVTATIGAKLSLAGCLGDDDSADDTEDESDEPADDTDDTDEIEDTDDTNADDANGDADEETDPDADDDTDADEADSDAEVDETIIVGPDGDHRFEPDSLSVETETTVQFVWEDSGHNLAITSQPSAANWEGVSDLEDDGATHEHTFDVDGQYEYQCDPHAGGGMVGEILVGERSDTTTDTTDTEDETDDGPGGGY